MAQQLRPENVGIREIQPGAQRSELRTLSIYTIYDRVAQDYSTIFEAANDGVAVRNFQQAMTNNPYIEDFWLFHIGYVQKSVATCELIPNPPVRIPVDRMPEDAS